MSVVKQVKAAELFKLVDEIFAMNSSVWVTVTGTSMYPFLRGGRDRVELSKVSFDNIRRGDIVLIKRNCGEHVLHRVLKKKGDCFYIIGDAQQWIEGPLMPDQLLAVVKKIRRGQQIYECSSTFVKVSVWLWLFLIPLRYCILKMARLVLRLLRMVKFKKL